LTLRREKFTSGKKKDSDEYKALRSGKGSNISYDFIKIWSTRKNNVDNLKR
jgi:hypothetical protein